MMRDMSTCVRAMRVPLEREDVHAHSARQTDSPLFHCIKGPLVRDIKTHDGRRGISVVHGRHCTKALLVVAVVVVESSSVGCACLFPLRC